MATDAMGPDVNNNVPEVLKGFSLITVDVSSLQKLLITLAQQVEICQKDATSMKTEMENLKIAKRLEALEYGMEELSDELKYLPQASSDRPPSEGKDPVPKRNNSIAASMLSTEESSEVAQLAVAASQEARSESNRAMKEVALLKERLTQLERKAEAVWGVQENDAQLKAGMARLKTDMDEVVASMAEQAGIARSTQEAVLKIESLAGRQEESMRDMTDKLHVYEIGAMKAADEKREMMAKMDTAVHQLWDHVKAVDTSITQRMQAQEASQLGTVSEVNAAKVSLNAAIQRGEDLKRQLQALENKMESVNTQVAAALSPLHNRIASVAERTDEILRNKLDKADAISAEFVHNSVSRVMEAADRKADQTLTMVQGLETRFEDLESRKPDRDDVVFIHDFNARLLTHANDMDVRLDHLKRDIILAIDTKADSDTLASVDQRLTARISSLEAAILKGLKAISDKVAAALGEKLDISKFNEFKVLIKATLADLDDRLRDWSPTARAYRNPMDSGGFGATSCLCCDSKVSGARQLRQMGFGDEHRCMVPEKLPLVEPWHATINNEPIGAFHNAKAAKQRRDKENAAARSGGTTISESMPNRPGSGNSSPTPKVLSAFDVPLPLSREGSGGRLGGSPKNRIREDSISSQIAQGKIPARKVNMRNSGRGGQGGDDQGLTSWDGLAPDDESSPLTIDARG